MPVNTCVCGGGGGVCHKGGVGMPVNTCVWGGARGGVCKAE